MINTQLIFNFIRHFFSAKRKGHGVHSPFLYELCEEVFYNNNAFYDFQELQKTRKELLKNSRQLSIKDLGAGSKTFTSNKRSIGSIAAKGISPAKQSEVFYKLINYLKCQVCVELGTSLGLNTLYLAKANTGGAVISIEGSQALVDFANELACKHQVQNITFIHSEFDKALPRILNEVPRLDFLYVDGNHTCEATLNYFKMALLKKNNSTVIVFDDIYWSKGMTKAWQEIKEHPGVKLSVDAFYFGMVFFREESREKVDLKIYL